MIVQLKPDIFEALQDARREMGHDLLTTDHVMIIERAIYRGVPFWNAEDEYGCQFLLTPGCFIVTAFADCDDEVTGSVKS